MSFINWLHNLILQFLKFTEKQKLVEKPINERPDIDSPHPWLDAAIQDIGNVKEIAGKQNHPLIVEAHKLAGLDAVHWTDEIAWCGSYAFLRLVKAGVDRSKLPKEPAWAANWKRAGKLLPEFKRGCVCVIPSKVSSSGYHVSFGNKIINGMVCCVGGNQANSVNETCYKPEGIIYIWCGKD
jgi:uncharacterized protein (TIGR02594 family)